ncbi:MAG: sulfotransferase [Halioglobus sp.]
MISDGTISQRVFCIGMNKTGTSTINHCFESLSLTPIASPKAYDAAIRRQIEHFYKHKSYSQMLDLAEHYKAFEDRPWNMWTMYRHAHERFPDSRFILTVRDPESWWRSTERWITFTKPTVMDRYTQHLRVHDPSKESMTESYLRYNTEVQAYFAGSGKLLVMDLEKGDGWEKLCGFLGLPVPERPFPHANRQKYTPEDAQMIKEQRRLKRGLECQSCHNLTILKKKQLSAITGSSARANMPPARRLGARQVVNSIRNFGPESLKESPAARKLFWDLHRANRSIRAPIQRKLHARSAPFQAALPDREMGVVSCFFNPGGSRRRVDNFQAYLAAMKQSGIRCIVVELAFGNNDFVIGDHDDVIRLRSNDVLWHKERLLNIGIKTLLDEGYRKIVWCDGDIEFADANWPLEIANRLEHANLCQVFETIGIQVHEKGPPIVAPSAVKYFRETGRLYRQPARRSWPMLSGILKGGQSGFGWAARAEVLQQVMLFEGGVVGGGDKLIFVASLADDFSQKNFEDLSRSRIACSVCGHRNKSEAYTEQLTEWAQRWSAAVAGKVDYARLYLTDMYHGRRDDRGYMTRHDILYRNNFDPAADLYVDQNGCLAWSPGKEAMQREVEAYFLSRREDV